MDSALRAPEPLARARWFGFAFVVGLAITVLEFGAVRLFAPFFGQSPLVWANVIGVVLFALAVGAALGGRLAERPEPDRTLGRIAALAGLLACATPFLGPAVASALLPGGFSAGPALDLAALASLSATILVFGLPLTCLGALSPLALRVIEGSSPIGRRGGLLMMASTLGAVAGGYLATLVLIPGLGTRRTLLLCGAALVAAGALAPGRRRPWRLAGAGALALLSGADPFTAPLKGAGLPGDRVLLESESSLQTIRVLERDLRPRGDSDTTVRARILALDEGDAEYHSVMLEGRPDTLGRYYDVFAVLPELLERERATVRVLVLGFGAGSAWRVLDRVLGERLRMTAVEIDPAVIETARRWFDVPAHDPRLQLVTADARLFVESLPSEARYDIAIVDAYAQQQYIPFHVVTREFFERVRACLADDGILCQNLDARRAAAALPRAIAATVEAAGFERVGCLPLADFPSELLIARAAGRQPLLPARLPDAPFASVVARCWPKLFRHPCAAGSLVLTDDRAPIEAIIGSTLRRVPEDP